MSEDAGAGTGSPVSRSSEGVRGGEAGGCGEWPWRLLFMSLEPSVRQQDTAGPLRWVALLSTIRYDETRDCFSHLRHRKQIVRQLRVPLNRRIGRQSLCQAACRLDICHRISSAEYEQHRSFDALVVREDRALRPLQLGARPRRHEFGAATCWECGPEIGKFRGEALPNGGARARGEPGIRHHRRGGGLPRLRFEVPQEDESTEAMTDQDLRHILAVTHCATQRLQVTHQLAEAGEVPPA